MPSIRAFATASLLATLLPAVVAAQSADPVPEGSPTGYELTLNGNTRVERGHALRLVGVAHEVEGLDELRPRAGLQVDAAITARRGSGRGRRTVVSRTVRSEAGGRFALSIDVPDEALSAPRLELHVHRPSSGPGRRFTFSLSPTRDEALDLLSDRNRYQPGEDVRVWLRVRGERAPTPHAGRAVTLTLTDMRGGPLAEHEATTGASGVITAALTLPASAEVGPYRVIAEVADGGPRATRQIQVWRRTVERLLGEIELRGADEDGVAMVAPGGRLRGRVLARTPSGTPVRGATVQLTVRPGAEPAELTTDADGAAAFDVAAPAYLSGDVGRQQLTARIVHRAHGTIETAASYLMARVPAVVELTPRGGALVPEVDQTLYVSVSDPRGRPLPSGTEVVVRGEGLRGGEARARLDDEGFAEVTVALPRAAASRMNTGECAGAVATTFEVEVATDPPRFSRSCVPVAADAQVRPVVDGAPMVAPGSSLAVEVRRRPSVRGRPVLLEALFGGRAVAFAWVDGRASRGTIAVPADLLGVITLRARAARARDASEPSTEPGAVAFGQGAFDAAIVRPGDAFALEVSPAQDRYLVRETAEVSLEASRAPSGQAWGALLVRDQAAHGGEGPWDLYWMRGALHEAAQRPADEANARLLRASLAASMGLDPEPPAPAPLEVPYWRPPRSHAPYRPGRQMGRGVMRDPVALREELLRRGIGPIEMALERAVQGLGSDASERASITSGRGARVGFHPDVIAHLVSARRLSGAAAQTLGGEPMTVAMIERADPGFSFDTVARRVARQRLSRLLLGLLHLTNPDDPNAQRASANLPPERWLGTLVQLGMVPARELTDPWGRAFVFRRVTGRRPRVAVSERALEWELASPGPDGRLGTGDDVNDPFARAVPEGTPYAVVSGEESLMQRMSTLAPARIVLSRMSQAYERLSLAAREEQRQGPVSASGSEVSDEEVAQNIRLQSELGAAGAGRGAGGSAAFGSAATGRRSRRRAPSAPADAALEAEPEETEEGEREDDARAQTGRRRTQVMGAMIREDFPATLFFAGEVPLEGGEATVEVPLADALTTYRLEAIAWTDTGWTTSGDARLSVDQEALVDAPVPPFATEGDRIRLPVRVENRTDAPLPVSVHVEAEGLAIATPGPASLELPPRSAEETVVELALEEAGEGSLVVSVARDGEGLDAVRRPLHVLADARTARDYRTRLVDGSDAITIEVPAEASERGPGQLRVAVGARLFGDLAGAGHPLWGGWALAMAGEPLGEDIAEVVLRWVTYEDDDAEELREPLSSALALSAAWDDERLTDADARRALRAVGQELPAPEAMRAIEPESFGDRPSWLLLALAPMAQDLAHRPALREDAERLLSRLRRMTSSHAARATEAPRAWARAAAALALSGGERERAVEMVRRTGRHLVRVGAMAWVEPEQPTGREPRARPTAFLALAQTALGRRAEALALVRSLVDMQRAAADDDGPVILRALVACEIIPRPPFLEGVDRALMSAAAARLAPGTDPGDARVRLDGRPVEIRREGDVQVAVLEGLGRPGTHTLEVSVGEGRVALAQLALAYGMPWDVAPRREAPIAISIDGEVGARDTRAALLLGVQNRGARMLTRPVVEIELPAGAELDEPTREALAGLLRADAHQEGRTLVLPLRPLAPGAWVRVPLRVRWSLGGALRGLGATAWDALGPDRADVLPVAVLPSRAVEIPDEGPEPEPPDAEASEPPVPILEPLLILGRLTPGDGGDR